MAITFDHISSLVSNGESETLEFKETTGTRREAAKTICAMLNQQGGLILFGVLPNGKIIGQNIGDRTIEELSAEICRIEPKVYPTVEKIRVKNDHYIIAVLVSDGASKPYSYKGAAYLRVGNTTVAMSSEEYSLMLMERFHEIHRWEIQPASGWTVKDLDVAEIRDMVTEAIQQNRLRSPGSMKTTDLLHHLGLMQDGVLLRAAVVLFGKTQQIEHRMPECTLRVAQFKGIDRTEFIDNRQFYGNAFMLFQEAQRFLRSTLPVAGRFEDGRMERVDELLYPYAATREAIINALCHRDYSSLSGGTIGIAVFDDRLEVESPGSLHFGLTPESLFETQMSRPWNPYIARTFFRRGITEAWGRGVKRMSEEVSAAHLPPLEIKDTGGSVVVCFRNNRVLPPREVADDPIARQKSVLELLENHKDGLTIREIHAYLFLFASQRQIKRTLTQLKHEGLVASYSTGRKAYWKILEG